MAMVAMEMAMEAVKTMEAMETMEAVRVIILKSVIRKKGEHNFITYYVRLIKKGCNADFPV